MGVERYVSNRSRMRLPVLPCGCLALFAGCLLAFAVGFVLLLPSLPGIAAQLIGFRPSGDVDSVFEQANNPAPPTLQNAAPAGQVTLQLGGYGEQILNNSPQLYNFTLGTTGAGTQAVSVTFTEPGLMELCRQRTTLCSNTHPQFRNTQIDLRPGGVVLYADATLPQLGGASQRLGIVLRVDGTGRRFQFVGVDINGGLFTSPPPELSSLVLDFERAANEAVAQVTLETGGSLYALSRIFIDDSVATLILE